MRKLLPTDQVNRLSRADILATLRGQLSDFINPNQQSSPFLHCSDMYYRGIKPRWVVEFINSDVMISSGPKTGNPETFDCDDYTFYLKTQLSLYAYNNELISPLAVGCLITPTHAFNLCVESRGILHLIDTHSKTTPIQTEKVAIANVIKAQGNSIDFIYF